MSVGIFGLCTGVCYCCCCMSMRYVLLFVVIIVCVDSITSPQTVDCLLVRTWLMKVVNWFLPSALVIASAS